MDPNLVDLARRLAAGDPTARSELASDPSEMARALDDMVGSLEKRTALLVESEEYFRALTQQSLVGICVAARDRILYANDTLAGMVGYTRDEILDFVDFLDVIHAEDRPTVARNLERRFRGETFRATFRMLRKGGGSVQVEADGRRVLRRGEPVIIACVVVVAAAGQDRAESRRERQVLFRSEKMATLGELLGGLAHELNNSFMVTLTQANLIERTAGTGPVADLAHTIAEKAQGAGQIAQRVASFVRDYPPAMDQVALNDVVREVVELFEHSLRRARIDVALDLADGLPAIWADPHQLHELVAHLIANALQAMRGRQAPRRLRLRTATVPETARVALEVSDTGAGVSAEVRPRLFEPFFSTKPAGVGTGLGLFVCQEIARERGGSIALLERAGPGATFRVELPQGREKSKALVGSGSR
jgi:PAS domain S-box-containing protein